MESLKMGDPDITNGNRSLKYSTCVKIILCGMQNRNMAALKIHHLAFSFVTNDPLKLGV
jgi:hypothetical protein